MFIEPSLVLVMSDGQGLAFADFVDEADGDEVVLADGLGLGDCEGIAADGFDGTPVTKSVNLSLVGFYCVGRRGSPDVDQLHAAFQQFICFIWKMEWNARESCSI